MKISPVQSFVHKPKVGTAKSVAFGNVFYGEEKPTLQVRDPIAGSLTNEFITPSIQDHTSHSLHRFELRYKNNLLGSVRFSPNPSLELNLTERIQDYGQHLQIWKLESYMGNKYRGIGTLLLDEVFKKSLRLGYDGKMSLNAENSKYLKSYLNLGEKYPSPIPFYFNYGFKSVQGFFNDIIKFGMDTLLKTKQYTGIQVSEMYLPEESIKMIMARIFKRH